MKKTKKKTGKSKRPAYLREIEIRYKKRRVKADSPIQKPLTSPHLVYELFADLQNEVKEKLITISLDAKMKLICFEVVSIGSVSAIHSRPIEVLRAAIPLNPYGIILVHNHPTGDPSPGEEDKKFTSNLLVNTNALGLKFYDHIIIGHDGYYSFAEHGLMEKLEKGLSKKA